MVCNHSHTPNETTIAAMEAVRRGEVERIDSMNDLRRQIAEENEKEENEKED